MRLSLLRRARGRADPFGLLVAGEMLAVSLTILLQVHLASGPVVAGATLSGLRRLLPGG